MDLDIPDLANDLDPAWVADKAGNAHRSPDGVRVTEVVDVRLSIVKGVAERGFSDYGPLGSEFTK